MTKKKWGRLTAAGIALLPVLSVLLQPSAAQAGTIDQIRRDNVIRIAYRADAPPFSFRTSSGEPGGFMVDLCQAVTSRLAQQLSLAALKVQYVLVTAENRFETIQQDKADLLCEPTSSTLSRRKLVDFSVTTFVDGAGLMIKQGGPTNIQALAGLPVGVLANTTTENELRKSLAGAGITAQVIQAKTHAEGLAMLESGKVSAYFADRSILLGLARASKSPESLRVSDAYLTIETYALAMRHGDDDFRLEVDTALSHVYGSGEINSIVQRTFGNKPQPGSPLNMVYLLSGFPD